MVSLWNNLKKGTEPQQTQTLWMDKINSTAVGTHETPDLKHLYTWCKVDLVHPQPGCVCNWGALIGRNFLLFPFRQIPSENDSLETDFVESNMCVCLYALHCQLCECLYALHSVLALRMPLCVTPSTFPAHASMHFIVYFPCAHIYALATVLALCMPLCITQSTFPARASMHFTVCLACACIYALASVLALRMPICISLATFPAHASMRCPVYFPCACIYAFYCLLSLCTHLCTCHSSCPMHFIVHFLSLRTHLRTCLSTCPMHASMRFTVNCPCACVCAFHFVLALCISLRAFPTHASIHCLLSLRS